MNGYRVKGETAKPVALLSLMAKIGPTKTSKQLGVSTTTLYKARKTKTVSRVYEVAAEAKLAEFGDIKPPAHATLADAAVFIGEIPRDKADLLKRVAAAMGATLEVEP